MKLTREEFLQQMVLTLAAKQDRFVADTAVDVSIVAFERIKSNVLKNSAEFTTAGRQSLKGGDE